MPDTNRYIDVNKCLNDVAVEVGLMPETDPWSSDDPNFVQMKYLLNNAGLELVELYEWPVLLGKGEIIVDTATYPENEYPLPDDFGYMIDQTYWDRDANLPLQGPLSAQQWTYLEGRDLASSTIYASFRIANGDIALYPAQNLSDGRRITYEYIRRTWIQYGSSPSINYRDEAQAGTDTILFEPILIKRFLKLKWLGAKGFDTTIATQEFVQAMDTWTGRSKGAPILNAYGGRGYPFLNVWRNVGDTNYGL